MPIHTITTSDTIAKSQPPYCAKCKERKPGMAYGYNANGELTCSECLGRSSEQDLIRVVPDEQPHA